MVLCAVKTCGNRSSQKTLLQTIHEQEAKMKKSFHRFPKDRSVKLQWLISLNIFEKDLTDKSVICSDHFLEEDVIISTKSNNESYTTIRKGAIPSKSIVKLTENASEWDTEVCNDYEYLDDELDDQLIEYDVDEGLIEYDVEDDIEYDVDYDVEHGNDEEIPVQELNLNDGLFSMNVEMNNNYNISEDYQSPTKVIKYDTSTSVSEARQTYWKLANTKDITTSISPESRRTRCPSPSRQFLIDQNAAEKSTLQNKVKTLQKAKIRHIKKISSLKNILSELHDKRFLRMDEIEMLDRFSSKISIASFELLKRQLAKSNPKMPVPKVYSPELRTFALSLHYYSPAAYNYVRESFDTCLPHPKTLSSWYKHVDGSPGFSDESFKFLKSLVDKNIKDGNKEPLIMALSLDEMAIRKHVEFDGYRTHGYVEVGAELGSSTLEVATQALVMLLTGVNNSFKIPIGFFLIHSATGEQRATLVKIGLEMLQEIGIKTISLTFDGAPSNFAMVKCLGCDISPDDLKPSFHINDEEIHIIPDPSHMIKLVRNTLGDRKQLINGDGKIIDWEYLEKLNNLQMNEGLHLANKLKPTHIAFKKKIMNVRLATQVLSESVSDALKICDQKLKLKEFENSSATSEFLLIFNNVFDIFNTRTVRGLGFKKALCQKNKDEIFHYLLFAEAYIKNLKLVNGDSILKSNRKTGFLGFLICIKSLQNLFHNLIEMEKVLVYIPCYKISQDHLEIFFGKIRAFGRCNNNPTAQQFKSAYKKLLVHTEIRGKLRGNCLPLEDISILNPSPIKMINKSTITDNVEDDGDETVSEEEDLDLAIDLNQFSEYVVTYISGFVGKKIETKLKCSTCVDAVLASPEECLEYDKYSLISLKTHGGLKYPSADLIKICEQAEKAFKSAQKLGEAELNNMVTQKKLTNKVLKYFNDYKVFESYEFKKHLFDNFNEFNLLQNHYIMLINAICELYYKIRYSHYIKTQSKSHDSPRTVFNKLTLFRGF